MRPRKKYRHKTPADGYKPQRLGAQCQQCPLFDGKPIPSDKRKGTALAIIGEAPGGVEERTGIYFQGESGKRLKKGFAEFGIPRHRVHINNALQCRPPRDFEPKDWRQALECCRPRLESELRKANPRMILAVGKRALHALSQYKTALFPFLGSTIDCAIALPKSPKVLSTIHPAFCLRGNRQYFPIFYSHLEHAWQLATGQREPWEWQRLLYYGKSEKQILTALRRLAKMKRGTLGIDIETAGPDPMTDRITVIGMATNAISVSLLWPPEQHFRTMEDAQEAYQLTAKILAGPLAKAAHNGIHDILGLKQIGLTVGNYTLDTILMHHVAGNTLKHDLGFVAQTEFACDPWKKIFKVTGDAKGLARFTRAKPEELTLYNAKDSGALPPLASVLANRLDNTHNGWELYNGYLERSHIALSMQQWGARISQAAVERHEKPLKRRIRDARRELRQAALETGRRYLHIGDNKIPMEDLNPASNPQRKELFFKVLRVRPRIYTPKGAPSLKEEFVQLLTAHHNPIVAKCARALLRYRKYTKLYGTIRGLRGVERVYPQAKVWGTKAGRWSYDNFPAQTAPKILRDIVIASVGNWIVSADYSQLEMRIMAWLSGDPLLLDWFETGKDPHSETAIGLFGSAEGEFRQIAKTSNYADAYGADSKTLWINITKSLPKLGITLLDVERIQETKARLHPTLIQWRRDLLAKAQADDYVEHPLSGRRIHFHGEVEPSKVYNSPIQGTAADIINRAIVGVHRDILKIPNSHLLFQVHDELVVDASDPVRAAKVLRKHMSAKVSLKINDKVSSMEFPVDYKIGHDWGKRRKLGRKWIGMEKFKSIEEIEKWWSKLGTRKRKGAK